MYVCLLASIDKWLNVSAYICTSPAVFQGPQYIWNRVQHPVAFLAAKFLSNLYNAANSFVSSAILQNSSTLHT